MVKWIREELNFKFFGRVGLSLHIQLYVESSKISRKNN